MLAFSQKLLRNQFVNGDSAVTPRAFRAVGVGKTNHIIQWGAGVSAGEVTIEKADREDYTGTWAPVTVVTYSGGAPKEDYVFVGESASAFRHRITQPVLEGTVTSKISAVEDDI